MTSNFLRRRIFILLLILFFSFKVCLAKSSILSILSASENFAFTNYSLNNNNFTHPLFLLNEKKPKLIYGYEYEDIYKLTKNNTLVTSLYAYKNKITFIYPRQFKKINFTLGLNKYFSQQNVFIDDDIKNTKINFKASGEIFSIAGEYKNFLLGYFNENSNSSGNGISEEIINQINIFSPDTKINLNLKEKKEGIQFGLKYKKNILAYQQNKFKIPSSLRISDNDDNFYLPLQNKGKSYNYSLLSTFKNLQLFLFYQKGSGNSYDNFYYNNSPTLGVHLANNTYKNFGLSLKNKKIIYGIESYKGKLEGAASIDIIGSFFGFIGGYYLIHYNSYLKFNKFSFTYNTTYKRFSLSADYNLTFFNLNSHFDGVQKFFFGLIEGNATEKNFNINNGKLHQLSLGIKKEIKKNIFLNYTLTQQIPQIKKEESKKITGVATEEKAKANTKGGTLHTISLEYKF